MKKREEEKTTGRLERVLSNVKTDTEAMRFIHENTTDVYHSFPEYFNDYMVRNQLDWAEVKDKSGISKNYIYNILNGDRKPGRDKILALCIAAGMNFGEINKALHIAGEGVLYPKNERDARIAIAVNNRITNVMQVNLQLEAAGVEIIK